MYSGILADGRLEFTDDNGDTIDEHQKIRATQTLTLNGILVYNLKNVVLRIVKINVIDMQSHLADIIAHKVKTLVDEPEGFPVSSV